MKIGIRGSFVVRTTQPLTPCGLARCCAATKISGKVSVFGVKLLGGAPGGKVSSQVKQDLAKGLEDALNAIAVMILSVRAREVRGRSLAASFTLDVLYKARFVDPQAVSLAMKVIDQGLAAGDKLAEELRKTTSFRGQTSLGASMGPAKVEKGRVSTRHRRVTVAPRQRLLCVHVRAGWCDPATSHCPHRLGTSSVCLSCQLFCDACAGLGRLDGGAAEGEADEADPLQNYQQTDEPKKKSSGGKASSSSQSTMLIVRRPCRRVLTTVVESEARSWKENR